MQVNEGDRSMVRIRTLLTAAIFCAGFCFGASPAIGTNGNNGVITEGAQLETAASPSDVNLENGVSVRLSPRSAGTVFSDHLVLEQGSLRVGHFNRYTVDAGQLQIQATDAGAEAVVRMTNKTVEVASVGGNLNVTNGGAMLTRIVSGTRVSFQQGGPPPPGTSRHKMLPSDQHIMVWMIGITAVAALAIGLTAAAQGKSPF
jgi:ferric-dicitrate binding protein FerR (iron transport regulator)